MTPSRVRLDPRALFWRLAAVIFVVREIAVWLWIQRLPVRHPISRVFILLFARRATRVSLLYAVVLAGLATLLAELLVRGFVRPLVARWHSPRVDPSDVLFHLAPGEWLVGSTPARRASGALWTPGILARTNHRLCFFPARWDAEPWIQPLSAVREARLQAAPAAWGVLRDLPDRLEVRAGDTAVEVFAVASPETAIAWFSPLRPAEAPAAIGSQTS